MSAENDEDHLQEKAPGCSRRERILERLYKALESKMDEIEARSGCARGEDIKSITPAESERDARTLNTLARMLEKLTELGNGPAGEKGDASTDPKAEAADAERMRGEIADRIARLREGGGG